MATANRDRFSLIAEHPRALAWLTTQSDLGRAPNTVEAYGRALQAYLAFSQTQGFAVETATRANIARYVRELTSHPSPAVQQLQGQEGADPGPDEGAIGLGNATIQLRLTVIRLFYDYLVEEGVRPDNPVGRGRYTPGTNFGRARDRPLVRRVHRLPWIPTEEQWTAILQAAKEDSLRNRFMLALAYDAALRREELCALQTGDFDPAYRLVRIRAETTKSQRERVVPYTEGTGLLHAAYLQERLGLSRAQGPLFLSRSHRNQAQPISLWTWSDVVGALAKRAEVPNFTTHTLRHLRLTDLARAGWSLHELAQFAGHRSLESTMLYLHLSGRDLARKLGTAVARLQDERAQQLRELAQ
jgi:integrase/recombinase XerD